MDRLVQYFSGKYLAAWVILISDALTVFISFLFATILRFNFELSEINIERMILHGAISLVFYTFIFSIKKTSTAVLRHSGLNDLIKVVQSALIASTVLVIIASILDYGYSYRGIWLIPKSILIIQFLLASILLSASRLIAKATYAAFLRNNSNLKSNILIFGAGESGRITCQTLRSGRSRKELISVVGFLDDNPALQGKSLEGLPVFAPEKALRKNFFEKNQISQVVLSVQNISNDRRREITDLCLDFGLEIREIPPYDDWVHGELTLKQIKPVRIENLLGRSEISLDSKNIDKQIHGKTILVTGGAGSIGSEIARQALHFSPKKVLILDQAESAMYDLEIDLHSEFGGDNASFEILIGNVNNQSRMRSIFERYRPEIVFHAAAYKHVPMMELNPYEAVLTNVFGTRCIADLSKEFGVGKFVLVSTDKAINPTNIMGATKRIAEIYTQVLSEGSGETGFIITRFGNVLGSNGSVIPLFKKQIDKGGPITITHKNVTRFFMTIAEACNLVLEAGSMGKDGEIFVFDMGKPIRIYDLAEKMIRLSGLEVEKDIKIMEIGLRPGEKLYEEVLANDENTIPTHHEKILKALVTKSNLDELEMNLNRLEAELNDGTDLSLASVLKEIVPEFVSNNSEFSKLDSPKKQMADRA